RPSRNDSAVGGRAFPVDPENQENPPGPAAYGENGLPTYPENLRNLSRRADGVEGYETRAPSLPEAHQAPRFSTLNVEATPAAVSESERGAEIATPPSARIDVGPTRTPYLFVANHEVDESHHGERAS